MAGVVVGAPMTHLATTGLHRAVMHSAWAVAVDCLWAIFPWAQPCQASRPCLLASAFLTRRALLQRGASTLPVPRSPRCALMLLVGMGPFLLSGKWNLFCICGRLHMVWCVSPLLQRVHSNCLRALAVWVFVCAVRLLACHGRACAHRGGFYCPHGGTTCVLLFGCRCWGLVLVFLFAPGTACTPS